MQFAVKIDQVEDFLKNAQEFDNIDTLKELLLQQEHHTKGTNNILLLAVCVVFVFPWIIFWKISQNKYDIFF